MAEFNKKGKYLTAEVRFRYNEKEGIIDATSIDPDLKKHGFLHKIHPDTSSGRTILQELSNHLPDLRTAYSPPSFPNSPMLLPDAKGEPLKIPLGTDEKNEEVCWDVTENAHALISGRAGSGKSFARTVIYRHLKKHEDTWDVIGIDTTSETRTDNLFTEAKDCQQWTSYSAATILLNSFRKGLENRSEGFTAPHRTMIIVENFDFLMGEYQQDINSRSPHNRFQLKSDLLEDLTYIARVGRSAGVHLCVVAQRVSEETVPANLRHNLLFRYALAKHSSIASLMTLDSITATQLENKAGQGVVSSPNGDEKYLQGYYPLPRGK